MAQAPNTNKPNILTMWGDDIGQSNLSYYTKGMMGYRTSQAAMRTAKRVCGKTDHEF